MRRLVLDTNVLVSAALFNGSVPHRALLKARAEFQLLATDETLAEFSRVLFLPKFDGHVVLKVRKAIFEEYSQICLMVPIPTPIRVCRDPRDDKFLEAAVHGQADAIISGDLDLLSLDPFHGVRLLTPASFLDWQTP
jgi:putative PIN family toxin of toxin-antitoxin system